jgi:aromatic ring-opening dioxygenase catalytic subunit (LigB family)
MHDDDARIGRRTALGTGLVGLLGASAALAAGGACSSTAPEKGPAMKSPAASRLPTVYLPHGGGPWPFVDLGMPRAELDALAGYLRGVGQLPAERPRALLVISAHWEERVPTVSTSAAPPMLYDYYGFPPESYTLQWPAKGDPALAAEVRGLLEKAGFETASDGARGFDHGTFIPMMLSYPQADVPTVQLSLKAGLDPREHLAMGRALAPLRDQGVFIVGSGMSFHNMRAFLQRGGGTQGAAQEFDTWLKAAVTAAPAERDRQLTGWVGAPSARFCHPREEHLLPLMVIAGAAGEDVGRTPFSGQCFGLPVSAVHFG